MAALIKSVNARIRANPVLDYVCSTRTYLLCNLALLRKLPLRPAAFRDSLVKLPRARTASPLLGTELARTLLLLVARAGREDPAPVSTCSAPIVDGLADRRGAMAWVTAPNDSRRQLSDLLLFPRTQISGGRSQISASR